MKKTQRILFGPDLVVLGPHEEFNVLSLSGNFVFGLVCWGEQDVAQVKW